MASGKSVPTNNDIEFNFLGAVQISQMDQDDDFGVPLIFFPTKYY